MEKFKCCICGEVHTGYGNNPFGAMWKDEDGNIIEGEFGDDDRCCDACNSMYVIPGRMYKIKQNQNTRLQK